MNVSVCVLCICIPFDLAGFCTIFLLEMRSHYCVIPEFGIFDFRRYVINCDKFDESSAIWKIELYRFWYIQLSLLIRSFISISIRFIHFRIISILQFWYSFNYQNALCDFVLFTIFKKRKMFQTKFHSLMCGKLSNFNEYTEQEKKCQKFI